MKAEEIQKIGNLGAGTMGHATALQFALAGYEVALYDVSEAALTGGMALMAQDLETLAAVGILTESAETVLARVQPTTQLTDLSGSDFVIESVFEDLEVKRDIWQALEAVSSATTIFATNTSGLSPTAIAAGLDHPERLVVAHFWNPAQLMPLVEVVPGAVTSAATVTATTALINHIGKHAVALKKESLGFVGNRIQLAVLREALHIVEQGVATPEAVDDIVKYSLGRRWSLVGPVASADLGGLDVFDNISKYLYADLAREAGEDAALKQKVAVGQLGLKSGQGFYDWQGDEAAKLVAARDKALLRLLAEDKK